ncbi:hypothetical protein EVAR_97489_1 [Eumeta japonica]|uniref:Uncharacterized protein n=1 Tax=Eumeta variegata TaxID=151549 RepID=A0A4C1Z7H8_EUMVA|nr:hypothetical protein EVAR_97489_1 [Eumeta japonica]
MERYKRADPADYVLKGTASKQNLQRSIIFYSSGDLSSKSCRRAPTGHQLGDGRPSFVSHVFVSRIDVGCFLQRPRSYTLML